MTNTAQDGKYHCPRSLFLKLCVGTHLVGGGWVADVRWVAEIWEPPFYSYCIPFVSVKSLNSYPLLFCSGALCVLET